MIADFAILQAAAAGFAGAVLLAFSSQTGTMYTAGISLLIWALVCLAALSVTWWSSRKSVTARLEMQSLAEAKGILRPDQPESI